MNYNKKNISEIISRMSILSSSWAINSILLNSVVLSITFTTKNDYSTLGVIIIVYLASLFSILTSYKYFILEKQSIFLQKYSEKKKIMKFLLVKIFINYKVIWKVKN